jgi:hypothetical protein
MLSVLTVESEQYKCVLCSPTHSLLVLMSVLRQCYRPFVLTLLREGCSEHGRFGIGVGTSDSSSLPYAAAQR